MKIYKILYYFGALILIAWGTQSCNHATKPATTVSIPKDTLAYVYTTVREKDTTCTNKADTSCTHAEITYPIFNNLPELNDTIVNRVLNQLHLDSMAKATNVTRLAKNFIAWHRVNRDTSETAPYYLESKVTVLTQDSSLVVLHLSTDTYTGGAHGSHYISFVNWDAKAGRVILLSDIFTAGFKEPLRKIAEAMFRQQEHLKPKQALDNYFFEKNKFALNSNFCINDRGILFLYNEYEIKSYAEGTTDLLIPYSQIKSLLRPNTVVSPYVK